jgi:hypothetical protein
MASATLAEVARSTGAKERDVIEIVLQRLDDPDRTAFLQGLSERVIAAQDDPGDATATELARWVMSWFISGQLDASAVFHAQDEEADKLIAAGKLTAGITGPDLRARYRR